MGWKGVWAYILAAVVEVVLIVTSIQSPAETLGGKLVSCLFRLFGWMSDG